MKDDERCCGTGTCLIDSNGRCWCGQQWNGTKMCQPDVGAAPVQPTRTTAPNAPPPAQLAPQQ